MVTALVLAHVRVRAGVQDIQDQGRLDVGGKGDDAVAAGGEPGYLVRDHAAAEFQVEDEHIREPRLGQPGGVADDLGHGDPRLRIRADPGDHSFDHDGMIVHDRDGHAVFQRASTHKLCSSR